MPEIIETLKGSFTMFFGTVRQKISTEKLDTPPPPPIHKLFGYRKFSETQHRRLPVRNFSALWDKKMSTENLDTPPPSYPNFFDTRNQCSSKGFPYGNFRHCETKNFRRKILILPPPLLSIKFFATGNFLKHSTEGFTCETFRQCETKGFRRKIVILSPPPPPLIHKLFGYRKFSETQHKRFELRNFSALWDKRFSTENLDTTPLSLIQTFSVPEINATVKDSPTQIFGTVRQKIFDGKSWYSPLPLSSKLFRYPKSMQQ